MSTIRQKKEGISLEGQEREIIEYCKRNNINLVKVYRDEGISGKDIEGRDEFKEMLDYALKNNVDTIISFKLSRFTRKLKDLANTIDLLDENDINLIFIEDGINTKTPTGRFMCYIVGAVAEMERENTSDFVSMTMGQNALKGNWNGGIVFGYDSDDSKKLIINKDEKMIVEKIFYYFTEKNWGYKKIANYLNHRNLKTKKGTDWSINSIKQVLDNPIYVGKVRWGQHKDWDKKRRKGKTEEYILVDGNHEPIISEETWEKAQAIRKVRGKKSAKVYEGNFLLSGLLRCPQCGASMLSHRTKKKNGKGYYRYYQCSSFFNKGSSVCKSNLINADLAEETVIKKINEFVQKPEIIETIVKEIKSQSQIDTEPYIRDLQVIDKELAKVEKKKKENLQLQFNEKIDAETLSEMNSFLREKEKNLNYKKIAIMEDLNQLQSNTILDADEIQAIFENFNLLFEKADVEQKKKLLRSIIDEIYVNDSDNIKNRTVRQIKFYFEPQEIPELVASKKQSNFATNGDTVHRTDSTSKINRIYLVVNIDC